MEHLPAVDEYGYPLSAPPDQAWEQLCRVLVATMGGGTVLARLLRCEPLTRSGPFDGTLGQTLPGFRVVGSEPGRCLQLRGSHRFSRYDLTFLLSDGWVRAQTRAAFPGALGRLYRAAVIGSGGHRIVTRRMLRQVARLSS